MNAAQAMIATPVVPRAIRAYEALRAANEPVDHAALAGRVGDKMSRAVWLANVETAVFAIGRPPASDADLMLQVGLAATFMGIVCDACEEDSNARSIALAVGALLENATLYLAPRSDCPDDLIEARNHYVGQAKMLGGEVAA